MAGTSFRLSGKGHDIGATFSAHNSAHIYLIPPVKLLESGCATGIGGHVENREKPYANAVSLSLLH